MVLYKLFNFQYFNTIANKFQFIQNSNSPSTLE